MKTNDYYFKGILRSVIFFFSLCVLISCGNDDSTDNNQVDEEEIVDLSTSIVGYWTGFYEQQGLSSYTFISFNSDKTYAMFLNDDAFSSGTYTVSGSTISLKSGYDETITTLTEVTTDNKSNTLSFKIDKNSYKGNKSDKEALNLENILIGKSYTTYLANKPIVTTFNTKYSATRAYKRSKLETLYIYWQYVYNGKYLYVKNFESPNEQHPTTGGWNTFEKGKVYIYNVEMNGGNIESWVKIEEQRE